MPVNPNTPLVTLTPEQRQQALTTGSTLQPFAFAGKSAAGVQSSMSFRQKAIAAQVDQVSRKYGLDPVLVHAVIQQESGYRPEAVSRSGAIGLMQLMPATAAGLGVTNPRDPAQNLDGGARYLSEQIQRFGGNVALALAAYNAGPGAVQKYGGIPPYAETRQYVRNILKNYLTQKYTP
jgi:soluble lytic murein transglycosylase-like protein